jgi:TrmH family RNA methyltransferase
MTIITSPQNPRLKSARGLQSKRERERSGMFLAEGEDLVAAAEHAGRRAVEGYRVTGSELGGADFVDVQEQALAAVSTLGSGTRVIGVYEQRWAERPAGPLCVYLHGVGDPGNVGAVLRSAKAFGVSSVAFGPDCADPHSPKAVRASMGAIFDVEIARVESIAELPGERIALVAHGGEVLRGLSAPDHGAAKESNTATTGSGEPPSGGNPSGRSSSGGSPSEAWPSGGSPTAVGLTLLVGAEREGLPADVVAACERTAHIPIETESLNAAMAATVALYEMTRSGESAPASSRVEAS